MIYDSRTWKKDLRKCIAQLKWLKKLKYYHALDSFFNRVYHCFDREVLYSAIIARKLIESDKLSDAADSFQFDVVVHRPRRNVDKLHRWIEDGDYEWDSTAKESVLGKNICNSIIHSYVYCLFLDEKTNIGGFFVSSDFDRNKLLYQVNLNSWIDFLEYIVDDDVAATTFHFNKGKKEYVSRRKVKGSDHKL